MHEQVMYIPVWELAFINGHGPRVQESGLGLISGHAYSAPYEDVKLKAKVKRSAARRNAAEALGVGTRTGEPAEGRQLGRSLPSRR